MKTLEHNGIKLAYDDTGSGGPTFVFVHGWTCDRSFFAAQAEYFSKNHRVVSVDLRGHGDSDKPEIEYPISAYAEDLAHIIKELNLGPVIAVGHSMGGLVVLQLAAMHPENVKAIVMIDPAPFVPTKDRKKSSEKLIASIEAGETEPQRLLIASRYFLPSSSKRILNQVRDAMMSSPAHVAIEALRGIVSFNVLEIVDRCKVPALHLAATPPLNPPHLMSEWMPSVVNGWTVGAGHFSQLEVPDQVNAMIEAFFRNYVEKSAV